MTSAVQIRRDADATIAGVTPLEGELAYSKDTKELAIGDGSSAGGTKLARKDHIHNATAKTTLADADEMDLADSAASYAPKKITWANIAAALWTKWGALIAAGTGKTTPVDADSLAIQDSASSNATKQVTFANLASWVGSKLGPQIAAATGKTTPVDADSFAIQDSAASNATKQVLFSSLKTTLALTFQPLKAILTTLGNLANASGVLTNDGSGNLSWGAGSSTAPTMRNRLVNPAMQISSINGNTSGTTSGYVPADNWGKYHVSSAGTLTVQRVQSVTPKGAKDRIRITVTAADTSIAAGEYLVLTQNMIGREVADFQYGGANAKQGLLRFLFKGPAGTYAISLGNAAQNRSYVALFTISAGNANTDTIQTFTIPGDTTGTWATDTTTGITLNIVLCCGSTFQGTTGWQSGNMFGTSGVSNGMGTVSSVFEIGEAGFYLDVASVGVFPTWELPSTSNDVTAVDGGMFGRIAAWVTFNGSTGSIYASSANVSSITRSGTGDYTVNFSPSLPDANYAIICTSGRSGWILSSNANTTPNTVSAARLRLSDTSGANQDGDNQSAVFIR